MTQTELFDDICEALNNLYNWDGECFSYWMDKLYDSNGEVWDNWTVGNYARMKKDVLYAFSAVINNCGVELVGK